MTSSKSTQKITDKVEPKDEYLEHGDIRAFYKPWGNRKKLYAFSFEYEDHSDSNPTITIKTPATSHGFASAIVHAYTLHQHLRFSPDDVWLTVAQGVSSHIWRNAERFRNMFVNHEGQKDLIVSAIDIIDYVKGNFIGDWPQAIARLSDATNERIKKDDLKKHLECDFSTSTNISITTSQIILIDAMKKYFKYGMRAGCGIPKVTLDGTLEDWLHLQEKIAKLRDLGLGLDFWLNRLEPVISQFIATYKGNVDENFWSMVTSSVPYASGMPTPCYDGWISALFPYTRSGNVIKENKIIPNEIPSGLVHVPFDMTVLTESPGFKLSFAAGFLGCRQDKVNEEYIISPIIGWYVIEA